MKLVFVLVMLLVFVGGASASITWSGSYILVNNQGADLSEINATLDNSALLEEVSPRIWLLKVDMSVTDSATLYINDSDADELRLLSMNTSDAVFVSVAGALHTNNTKITSWNTTTSTYAPESDAYRARVRVRGGSSKESLANSEILYLGTSSQIGFESYPGDQYNIYNCTITDVKGFVTASSSYGATVAYIENNNLSTNNMVGIALYLNDSIVSYNIIHNGIVVYSNYNVTAKNNTGYDGGWNGFCFNGARDSIAINHSVTNVFHNGMQISSNSGHPANNCTFKSCDVYDVNDNAYYITWDGNTPSTKIHDCLLEDCSARDIPKARGIATDGAVNLTVRRYTSSNIDDEDIQFLSSSDCYVIDSDVADDISPVYSDNSNVINTNFSRIGTVEQADVTIYYYLDVLVVDESGNPVDGATVHVNHPNASIDWWGNSSGNVEIEVKPINLNTREITTPLMQSLILAPINIAQTTTGADGHTPKPSSEDTTLVIPERRLERHGSPWYEHQLQTTYFNSFNVTVTKDGYSNNTTVNPDATWHRWTPDTYQNTTTIILQTGGTPSPVNLQSTKSTTWANHTWDAGSGNITDSYNVSVNSAWHNTTTNEYYHHVGMSPETWSNISVWAFNTTGGLSQSSASQNVQTDATGWTPSNTSMYYNTTSPITITTKTDGTNLFSRTPTQADGNATSGRLVVKT